MKSRTWIALSFAVLATFGFAFQKTWKGMIAAEPAAPKTLSSVYDLLNLAGFRRVNVSVENPSKVLLTYVSADELRGWVTNRLKTAGLRVSAEGEQGDTFINADKSTDEKSLLANDRHRSFIYVTLNATSVGSETIVFNMRLSCNRGVFMWPGYFATANVWDAQDALIVVPRRNELKDEIRKEFNDLFDEFEKSWKACNP